MAAFLVQCFSSWLTCCKGLGPRCSCSQRQICSLGGATSVFYRRRGGGWFKGCWNSMFFTFCTVAMTRRLAQVEVRGQKACKGCLRLSEGRPGDSHTRSTTDWFAPAPVQQLSNCSWVFTELTQLRLHMDEVMWFSQAFIFCLCSRMESRRLWQGDAISPSPPSRIRGRECKEGGGECRRGWAVTMTCSQGRQIRPCFLRKTKK